MKRSRDNVVKVIKHSEMLPNSIPYRRRRSSHPDMWELFVTRGPRSFCSSVNSLDYPVSLAPNNFPISPYGVSLRSFRTNSGSQSYFFCLFVFPEIEGFTDLPIMSERCLTQHGPVALPDVNHAAAGGLSIGSLLFCISVLPWALPQRCLVSSPWEGEVNHQASFLVSPSFQSPYSQCFLET